jgi:hypothetical protein
MSAVCARVALQERIFLRNLGGDFQGDSVVPLAIKGAALTWVFWAVVGAGIAVWAFFGLKNWANKAS